MIYKSFLSNFFQKVCRFSGQRPESTLARVGMPPGSIEFFFWKCFCCSLENTSKMDSRAWGGLLTFFTQLYPHALLDKGKRKNSLFAILEIAERFTLIRGEGHKDSHAEPPRIPAPIGRDKDNLIYSKATRPSSFFETPLVGQLAARPPPPTSTPCAFM